MDTGLATQAPEVTAPGVRLLMSAQWIAVALYAAVLAMLAVTAIRYDGLNFPPFGRELPRVSDGLSWDPKDVLGDSNIAYIATGILGIYTLVAGLIALVLTAGGVVSLAAIKATTGRLPMRLLISTVAIAACFAIYVSPFGLDVVKWMMD